MSTETARKEPVFVNEDGSRKVYRESRTIQTGPKAGQTYEYYNVYSPADKYGIDIPVSWSGYQISPEEAADLADGHEILVERTSSKLALNPVTGKEEPKKYSQILSPMPVEERQGDKLTFRSRKLVTGFPSFSRTNPNEISMISVPNFDAEGEEIPNSKVTSFRYVGPKVKGEDGSERGMVKVKVSDLVLAVQAAAKGEKYHIEGSGYALPVEGIKTPSEPNKSPMLEWGRVIFDKPRQGKGATDDAPLPSESAAGKGKCA
jgi:hypothetical protein